MATPGVDPRDRQPSYVSHFCKERIVGDVTVSISQHIRDKVRLVRVVESRYRELELVRNLVRLSITFCSQSEIPTLARPSKSVVS